jgi:hypothetical protein
VVVTAAVVVVVLLWEAVEAVAALVAPDGREVVDALFALVTAPTVVFEARSIARPIAANTATLSTVAAMRERAAAWGRRRAIAQPPVVIRVCWVVTAPVAAGRVVDVLCATVLPVVPVCGGVAPPIVPGCAGAVPPCWGMVPH